MFLGLLVFTSSGFAQGPPGFEKSTLGVYGTVSLPVGDFGDVAETGFGGGARFQYGTDTHVAFTASAGYLVWGKKEFPNASLEWSAWEILLGGKYYFTSGFFGLMEGGINIFTRKTTITGSSTGGASGESTETFFMLPLGLGYQHEGFEIMAKYFIYHPDANNFAFTLAYNFPL
jgi:hypothetical protein